MELEIDPRPDEAERSAIEAAVARIVEPVPDAWRAAALREAAEDQLEP